MTRQRPKFEIQGHRGARGLFPENTLEGFSRTLALGVRVIELDVGVTADGVAVVFHDVALNADLVRGRGGDWGVPGETLIRALRLAELAQFDVGRLRPESDYARRYEEQVPIDGARIPTLHDTLRLIAERSGRADVELKTLPETPDVTVDPQAMADLVLADAERAGAAGAIDVRSFDWRGLRAVRARRADVPLTVLTSAATEARPELWWQRPLIDGSMPRTVAAEFPGATWAPEHGTLTRERLTEAHALGLRVVPWTVNEPADMQRFLAWQADGVCTDRPDLALRLLGGG